MIPLRTVLDGRTDVRYVEEPESLPYFHTVDRIWHFPTGEVVLDRDRRRDCLVSDVDLVDVPTSGKRRLGAAIVLEDPPIVEFSRTGESRVLRQVDPSGLGG